MAELTKKAIVIGATSGIGEGIARRLVEDGYKVGITGRRTNLLEKIQRENPDRYVIKTFDVTDDTLAITALLELIDEMGGVDLVVANSGVGYLNERLDPEFDLWVVDVNVGGFTRMVNEVFRYFETENRGHLVAITSIAGLRGSSNAAAYHASKAFQTNYLQGLQQRVVQEKLNVKISNIRPGYVDTALIEDGKFIWTMPLDVVVKQIYKAIKAQKREVFITKRWNLIAWMLKLMPSYFYDRFKIGS